MAVRESINLTRRAVAPRPDIHYIQALRQEMDYQMRPARRRWEEIREVRARKHAIAIPDEYRKTTQEVRTHFVGDILRTVKSSLIVNFPTFTVPPSGPGKGRQENSTLKEKWSNALLLHLDSERLPKRVWPRLMDYAVTFGIGINKIVYLSWHDYPTAKRMFGKPVGALSEENYSRLSQAREDYKRGHIPFAWNAIDPRSWWGFYSEGRLRECLEVTQRTVNDLTSRYTVRWNPNNGRIEPEQVGEPHAPGTFLPTTGVTREFIEHWTDQWVTYSCDDVVLAQWRHGYNRVPYFPFYGLSNETADPGLEMESVVEHILDIVKLYDTLLTMWQNWAYLAAFPSGVVEGPDNAPAVTLPEAVGEQQTGPADMRFRPGVWEILPPGWKRRYDEPPTVGKDLMAVSDILRGFIERTIPDVLRGIGRADQAGYAINQLITAARLIYDPITDNASLAIAKMMEFIWWLVEHKIKEPVYVWAPEAA